MTVQQFHKKDNQSVLELPTQLESLKENNKEEYERVMSFYESEEWQKVERAHLNSDRRYYESHPFQRRVENKLIKRIEDRFEDKLLCESMKTLTPKQYQVIILFLKDKNTDEIAQEVGTTPGNVRKLRKRALEKLRTEYARLAMGCHEDFNGMIPYNIKRLNRCLDQPKHKKKRKKAA